MKHIIKLHDAPKRFTLDQDKVLPPEETVQRMKEKLKSLDLDILEETRRIDNGRLDIPVYFSSCGKDAAAVTGTKKQMGKGATPAQSEASAVMELVERFSFFSFCNNPDNFFIERHANIKDKAMPFRQIAQSVHDESEDLDIARSIFESLPLNWTWAFNLTENREVLIPFDWFYTINEFNGPSTGNCVEEALSQGICEIVERHVSSIISREQIRVPAIRPETITQPLVLEMLEKYRKNGIKLYLSDFSLGMGIPSVGVLAYDPSTFPKLSEIVWTAGTTPDPQKSLSRTLSEVAQLAGDFNTGSNFLASGLPKFYTLDEAEYIMRPDREISISDMPNLAGDNIRIEVENLIAALAGKQMDVIAVNTTHPLLETPAFYTIVPGAHFRERALGTSVGMFATKLIAEKYAPAAAIARLKAIEEKLPGKYYVHFYIGYCHLALENRELALASFRKALELEPNRQDIPSIYSYMGVCLKDLGEYGQALNMLKLGEQADADRTDIHNLMGFCHFKLKEHDKAINCFKKALAIDPSSAIDYANIASNYREMGETGKAIEYYELALALDPTIEFARESLSRLRN